MTTQDPIVIAGMARTAIGSFQGAYTGVATPKLGSAAISAALERAGVKAADVDEVLMGCVLPAGSTQPIRTSSTSAAFTPARSSAAEIAAEPSFGVATPV